MPDRRCATCLEYDDGRGICPGVETNGGAMACHTPIVAGVDLDLYTSEPAGDSPRPQPDRAQTGPEFPALVGLLFSGPVQYAHAPTPRVSPPPGAAHEVEPGTPAGPPPARGVLAGRNLKSQISNAEGAPDEDLRSRREPHGSAGVLSASSGEPDNRGAPAVRPIPLCPPWRTTRGRASVCGRVVYIAIILTATVAGAATDGGQTHEPSARQGSPGGRLGVPALLAAMRAVESGGDDNAVGDQGRSIGPYQIQLPYWTDGGGDPGRYRLDAWHADRCVPIIMAYWRRYSRKALAEADLQTLARVHNGGPAGPRKTATLAYWRKIQAAMANRRAGA